MRIRQWSLARQLFALQSLLVVVLVGAVAVGAVLVSSRRSTDDARDRVLGIADTIAAAPLVATRLTAAATTDPTPTLQPYAETVRRDAAVDFVTIMSRERIRYTHPNTALIGKRFVGRIGGALSGREFTETFTGTLGPSVRAVVPVTSGGRVVGLVAVGITTEAIRHRLARQLPYLVGGLAALLAVALAGAALVGRRLRRQTGGVDAATMSGMLATHTAVLESVREGLVVTDDQQRVSLINAEAVRLLGLDGAAAHLGRPVDELPVPESLREVLVDPAERRGELHLTGDRVLVVGRAPARWQGRSFGTVTTLRDRTELESLTGELDANRLLAASLHTQAHESANRLHTMIVLMETGRTEDAVRYGTEQLELSQRLTDRTLAAVDEPVLAALLLGKVAQAAERGIEIDVELPGDSTALPLDAFAAMELTTVVGNLLDNAMDACADTTGPGRVTLRLAGDAGELVVDVSDDGPGLPTDAIDDAFTRGWSTKLATTEAGRGLGLALVDQVVRRYSGDVTVMRSESGGARLIVRLPIGTS